MESRQWDTVGPADLLYVGCFVVGVFQSEPRTRLALVMGLFSLLVVVVDWVETRRLVSRAVRTRRERVVFLGLTLTILAAWLGAVTRPAASLPGYFALFAVCFSLQAVRDVAVRGLTPLQLVLEGYATLVAVFLVLGAAADAIDVWQSALVVVGGLFYVGRKSFQWVGELLSWLADR